MEFGVLGPLRVNGGDIALPAKPRVVLAVLLLHANRIVPVDTLVDALWDDAPPPSARTTLQGYVKQLRRGIGARGGEQGGTRVVTRSPGYLITVADSELDLDRFSRLRDGAQAAAARDDWADAAARLEEALALWRDAPLADVPSAMLWRTEVPRLTELRMLAVESRLEAALRLGRHGELVAELRRLASAEPLRERLHGYLMQALYQCGRQAEALAAFRSIDQRLRGELGISPGPELQRLHQRILAADPSLADVRDSRLHAPPERSGGPGGPAAVPRQLPSAVRHFIGRADEIEALASLLGDGGTTGGPADGTTDGTTASTAPGATQIAALCGMGGVGKTALAVYWAHQVAAAFPDGQLYVDLRGFSPEMVPMTPVEAVRGFLDALGVQSSRVPASAGAQYALYRSLVADKRLLVVLDNARDAAQVRPLLPGTASCVVLVTSRRRLTSLAAAEGARILDLDVFDPPDARELLARRLGAQRSEAHAPAVNELIELCSGLPLALSIAAARAAGRPDRLVSLVDDLRRDRDRLAALNAGDLVTDVRAVFSWSLRELDAPAARLFRVLGLHPGPDISVPAAASMAGYPAGDARRALEDLAEAHLLRASAPGRYAMHDLLLSFAAEQATDLPDADRRAAARRMLDHYRHSGSVAGQRLEPRRYPIALAPLAPGSAPETPADARAALAWLRRETPVLIAVARRAAELGFGTDAWQITWGFQGFLHQTGRWQELLPSLHTALSAAVRGGNQEGRAHMHACLGLTYSRLGAFDKAQAHLTDALALRTAIGDLDGQVNVHLRLSVTYEARGLRQDALDHALKALELSRAADSASTGDALSATAWCRALCGEFEQALIMCEESLRWYEAIGSSHGQASVLDTRGYSYQHLGRPDLAIDCFQRSAGMFREVGDRYSETRVLSHLGDAHNDAGAVPAARAAWQRALDILESLGHADAEEMRAKIRAAPDPACLIRG